MSGEAVRVARVAGDIDIGTREYVRQALEPLNEALVAIVDLSDVSYIDSVGIAELLALHAANRKRAGGEVRLVVASDNVARIVGFAGLGQLFRIYKTLDEASQ